VIAIDSTPYMGTLEEFTRTLLLITALGVMLVAVLGFMIARFGMRPVNTMSEQAHKLAPAIMDSASTPQPCRMNCKRWRKHSTVCWNARSGLAATGKFQR
jgi:HAMP domain-containing protein